MIGCATLALASKLGRWRTRRVCRMAPPVFGVLLHHLAARPSW